jgi:hypothetical protein
VVWKREHVVDAAFLDDVAAIQNQDPLADVGDYWQIVGDQQEA